MVELLYGLDERNNFKTEGVYDVNDIQKQITNLCSDSMYPQLRPDILSLEFEGKIIVAVKIEELTPNNKPCYYKPAGIRKGSYTRIGDRDDLMTDYELKYLADALGVSIPELFENEPEMNSKK